MKNCILSLFYSLIIVAAFGQTTQRWTDGVGSVTSGSRTAIATDLIGNVYTAGTVSGTGGTDWEVVSYLPDGTVRWTMTLNGSGSGADAATGIAIDSAFNIYICGYTVNSSSNEDITVRKIDSAGTTTWTSNYSRSSTANDRANAIVVKGNYVYVTGKSENASSNYDCTILKLAASDGSTTWASFFDGSGAGLDVGNSVIVDNSGNVYVSGSTVSTGANTDGMVLKYASSGTKTWSKTAGGTGTDDLFGVVIDGSGNVYVTGYKTVSGGSTTDYITAKFNSSGTAQWSATYNGSFSGYDKGKSIAIDGSSYIYVTGTSESASGNTDYLTICYNTSGTASWTQRYNGTGNAEDDAIALLLDGTDLVVTGSSKNSSGNYDFTTLSYTCSGGTLNWTMRTDGTGTGADMASAICRDEMGNIYVSGTNYVGSSTYELTTIGYFQKTKNDNAVTNNLMMLSEGLTNVYSSSSVRGLLFDMISISADCVWVAKYTEFVSNGDANSLNMTSQINSKISTTYGLNSGYNWISILTKRNWNNKQRMETLIGVPYFNTFSYSTFTSTSPQIAYNYTASGFPISCSACSGGQLTNSQAQSSVAWITMAPTRASLALSSGPNYSSCAATISTLANPGDLCIVCPTTTLSTLTNLNTGLTGSHEIGINLGFDANYAPCQDILDLNPSDAIPASALYPGYYANIAAVGGIYWDRDQITSNHQIIKKTTNPPIIDLGYYGSPYTNTSNYVYSTSMSLCEDANYFTEVGSVTERYSLYYGLYRLSRPGLVGMPPILFEFNYAQGLTFIANPDMNIYYGATQNGTLCSPSYKMQMTPDVYVINSNFDDPMHDVLGLNPSMDYIASGDFSTMTNFWNDNAITIGFGEYSGSFSCENNVLTFYADNTGSTCSSSTYSSLTLVGQLVLSSTGEYDFMSPFISNATFSSGTTFTVHVIARFTNGETIDQCQNITLVNGPSGTTFDTVCALIRGNISNYSSSPISYQVDIYH